MRPCRSLVLGNEKMLQKSDQVWGDPVVNQSAPARAMSYVEQLDRIVTAAQKEWLAP